MVKEPNTAVILNEIDVEDEVIPDITGGPGGAPLVKPRALAASALKDEKIGILC